MTSLSVAFVYQREPNLPHRDISTAMLYERFLKEVERHASCTIGLTEELQEAPESDFIVFAGADLRATLQRYSAGDQVAFSRRLVPMNASSSDIFEGLLEPLSLPAAIDSMSFAGWHLGQTGARGLHGLRSIGSTIGASCLVFQSENYCYFKSERHQGLPHLLVDYLNAYRAAMLGGA